LIGGLMIGFCALPALAGPPSVAVVGQTGIKTNTTCLRDRCDVYRDDTLSFVALQLRKSGLFQRVETGLGEADYRVRIEFTYTLWDPVEHNMVKQMLANHNRDATPPIYKRMFQVKFQVPRDGGISEELKYDLTVDAKDPQYRGLVNARDVALGQMVTRFLADARARGLMGLGPQTTAFAPPSNP
jgi:hypothetical protein